MSRSNESRGQRLLLLSIWVSLGFAVVSSVWGIITGSSVIVFDGLYSFVSIGLSVLAIVAMRFTRRGPDARFPWGREVAEPLVVVVKAATLAALCLYAAVAGVVDLVHGGRAVDAGWGIVYAALATTAGLVVVLVLRRGISPSGVQEPGSDLVRAEAAEWLGDTLLSLGVLVGFLAALVLQGNGRSDLAAYVDPAMVVIASLAFLRVPAQLMSAGMREVLTMSPPAQILDELKRTVDEVRDRYGFADAVLRASKVGSRMDVEIDFVTGQDSTVLTVADADVVRQDVHDRLAEFGYERSVVVTVTADPRWVR